PRSAVPRTPPPRSPNPSPERPRSALAAAILMTSLTGRTVAIPQPRQRSYSENDSSFMEESSSIGPYATSRDLGFERNWKEYACRQNVTSPVMSIDFDDEVSEEEMSEIDQEHSMQVTERKEVEPVYSVPHKGLKKTAQPSIANKLLSENIPTESDPEQHEDDSNVVSEGPVLLNMDESENLRARNHHLSEKNQELSNQLQEQKKQIKALRRNFKNLTPEKRDVAQPNKVQQIQVEKASTRTCDENDALKMTVHRLNVELSRYQKNIKGKIGGLPHREPPPPWLLDMKYLSPLLLAYEDRIREKDDLILLFEEEMGNFKGRIKEVIEENQNLHKELQDKRDRNNTEWLLIQNQAKLVLEENQVLMERLEMHHTKAKEADNNHRKEISRLTKQIMVLEEKLQNQEEELLENQKRQEVLRSKYDELKAKMEGRVATQEHVAMVKELKSQIQNVQEKSKKEEKDFMDRISSLQLQNKSLHLERNDLFADNRILESEVENVKKSNRKLQRKVGLLKQQLEDAMEKEVAAHQYLANLISIAEVITGERDELIHVTNSLKKENQGVLSKMFEGTFRLGKLEELVKVYKKKASGKLEGISHKLTEQEEDFAGKAVQYQREMRHLQRLLQDRQETLDEVLQQKRQVEGELEIIWESTNNENKQLKALLHKAVQNKWNTSEASHLFQHSPVDEYGFSYCDVNSSPREEPPTK
ncbi:hypothetical protein GDO86_008181, partial [Hymenochirus boettgeri]